MPRPRDNWIVLYLWVFIFLFTANTFFGNPLFAEHLPVFALADDSVVEIQGEPSGLHKAVELIATHLRKFLVDRSVVGVFEMQVSNMIGFVKKEKT